MCTTISKNFFLRQGYRGDADRAFINGKRRERKENLHGLKLGWQLLARLACRLWTSSVAGWHSLRSFGRIRLRPFLAQKNGTAKKPDETPRVYSRFWYSLGPVPSLRGSPSG